MRRTRLLWQLFPSYLIIIFVALSSYLLLEAWVASSEVPRSLLFVGAALIAALVAAFQARLLVRMVRDPLVEIRRATEQFARGEAPSRLYVRDPLEIAELAATLNHVGVQLDERIRAVVDQRNERDAVLGGMREGVIVLDSEMRILRLNGAALELLGLNERVVMGKAFPEVVRNPALIKLVTHAARGHDSVHGSVSLFSPEERSLEVYIKSLSRVPTSAHEDLLMVLNDVTHVRHLENVRREFVANVSHELRTPITAVKGFVETLLDGALHDPRETRRFLEIIERQVERLNAIFDDLLSLSRIEQGEDHGDLVFEQYSIQEVLETVRQSLGARLSERSVTLDASFEPRAFLMNRTLIEQALGNLVDNALKHSESGSTILVRGVAQDGFYVISVIDRGPGIEREHLTRIFERFYRVDKGRSRKQGGTGLGLSIVKHIAQAHAGSIGVESVVGEGSTFTLRLPLREGGNPLYEVSAAS